MKIHRLLIPAIGLIACMPLNAQTLSGQLPNGLTYYIRENKQPEGMADFFLVQKAGSVNETEEQRGLAHFLEHLCFNGTEHFPGNSLISWLEGNGVKFGKNLNAYTSTDETVYNICKVPVANASVVDSCLLVLHDWAAGVRFDPKAIDEERGVIENEWRHRNSATNRQLERALPQLYPGSIYGERMPIGKMEVVRNFRPATIEEFYARWYHPQNQALVIVGDFDAEKMEAQVKEAFSDIDRTGEAITSLPPVADNETLIVVCESDPEQTTNLIQLHFRHPEYDDDLAADVAGAMLAARFDEIELDPDCPYTYLGVGETKFMLSRGVKSLVMRGVAKPGRAADAVDTWYRELSRARRYGFTEPELALAKRSILKELTEKKRKGAKANSTELARRYVRNYLDATDPEEIAAECDAKLVRLDDVTLADANKYLQAVTDTTGRNVVILSYAPQSEEYAGVNAELLRDAFLKVNSEELAPYVAKEDSGDVLSVEPTTGEIVSVEDNVFPGTKRYTLSNGIKVVTWQSAETPDQIFIRGVGPGGLSQTYSADKAPTMKMINEILAVCGAGDRSATELKNLALTKKVNTSIKIDNTDETIESSTNRQDMADAFRMLWLKATDMRLDTLSVGAMLAAESNKLRNQHVNPIQVMGDSIHRNVYSRHPLGAKTTETLLAAVDPSLAMEIWRDRFSDMADFTFYVAGDFDRDSLENCLRHYVASLPANGRIERPKDIGYRFTQKNQTIDFTREMSSPVSVVYNFYTGDSEYDLTHAIAATIFGHVLRKRLMDELREKRGLTYSVQGHCSVNAGMNGEDGPVIMMPCYIKTEPGHEDEVNEFVEATVNDMLAKGISEEELRAVKEYLAKDYNENINDNAYRLIVMKLYDTFGQDMHTGYLEALDSLTDLRPYVKDLHRYRTTLIMRGTEQ